MCFSLVAKKILVICVEKKEHDDLYFLKVIALMEDS